MAYFKSYLWMAALVLLPMLFASCEKDDDTKTVVPRSSYTVTVLPNRVEYGTVEGSGTYLQGDTAILEAESFMGYYFIRWSDGNTVNPRSIIVGGNLKLYALFSDRADDPAPYNPNVSPGPTPAPDDDSLQTEGWVDLGLPSGLLWAACNVGASMPEDYGDYFAWGETQSKGTYNWSTYQYGNDYNKLTKYCSIETYGLNGYTDNLTTLEPSDDAATALMGGEAYIPTRRDWLELMEYTTFKWTTRNGVNGCRFTAANGNAIFLPAAGYRNYSVSHDVTKFGDYWSSSLRTDNPNNAWKAYFGSNKMDINDANRSYGFSVRAVRATN